MQHSPRLCPALPFTLNTSAMSKTIEILSSIDHNTGDQQFYSIIHRPDGIQEVSSSFHSTDAAAARAVAETVPANPTDPTTYRVI